MKRMTIDYKELSGMALIVIFELADKLNCTPKKAAQYYLRHEGLTKKKEVA